MRVTSLGSGSSGNGFLVDTDDVAFLIDCGVGARTIQAALREHDAVDRLAGVVLSHERIDHIRALESVLRRARQSCPVITTRGTYGALRQACAWREQRAGARFIESRVEISFVGVSHDAAEPCGFVIEHLGLRIGIFTDLGYVANEVLDAVGACDFVVLEANYDPLMLASGPYPRQLKRRIQSPVGHLSNDDCAAALAAAVSERTHAVWLAHLSETNNSPELARSTVVEALALRGLTLDVNVLPRHAGAEVAAVPAKQKMLGL